MFLLSHLRPFWLLILCKSPLFWVSREAFRIFSLPLRFWNFTEMCSSGVFCPLCLAPSGPCQTGNVCLLVLGRFFHITYFCSFFLKLGRMRRWRVMGDTVLDRVASGSLSDEVTFEQKLGWVSSRLSGENYYTFVLFLALSLFLFSFFCPPFLVSLSCQEAFLTCLVIFGWAVTLRRRH